MDAKLYAQTDTSSQNVPLLLKQERYTALGASKGEKEMFPLNGVSYVVMKVEPGRNTPSESQNRSVSLHDRIRLDYLLRSAGSVNIKATLDNYSPGQFLRKEKATGFS